MGTVGTIRATTIDERARRLRLPRTGDAPFESHGRLVWQRVRPQAHALRVFREDPAHRGAWVLATTLRVEGRTIEEVLAAGDLWSLVQRAETEDPVRILRRHGIAPSQWTEELQAAWRHDLRELAANLHELDRPPRRSVG